MPPLLAVDRVADGVDTANDGRLAIVVQLGADAADADANRVIRDFGAGSSDSLQQIVSGEHSPGIAHQKFQQRKLSRQQIDLDTIPGDTMILRIKLDIAMPQPRVNGA